VDGYASQGVYAGRDFTDAAWQKQIQDCLGLPYVAQHFAPLFTMPNCLLTPLGVDGEALYGDAAAALADPQFEPQELLPFNTMTGLFCYNGGFAGIYVRAGRRSLIVSREGGIIVPVLLA